MGNDAPEGLKIRVDTGRHYQVVEGFGASITDASAWLIQNKLNAQQRAALMQDMFDKNTGLGLNLTRVTIGASDFSRSHYSYDDMPDGQTDPLLAKFSIDSAKTTLLPIVRDARAINKTLRVFASPWSAPAWMKTTGSMIKGKLAPEHYDAFARYLQKTLTGFKAEGVPIYALTIQNEPHFQPENYPGMHMTSAERAAFVGRHLGPLLKEQHSEVRILDWDHNWDQPESPLAVLADPAARKYLRGTAWHCYGGDVSAQSQIHEKYPEKETWFTECSGGAWAPDWGGTLSWMTQNLIIGSTRNWAKGVILWNIALDENSGPHMGGCGDCRGVVTINQATGEVTRNVEYYVLGHASRFVRPGAKRIASDTKIDGIETVAFKNPKGGSIVLIALNASKLPRQFSVETGAGWFRAEMAAGSVVTYTWPQKRAHK
ncbi:MAG: glycoside hydrolase family 30 beta sandwich domain-containing protein [Chakrabartia sp.]